jgi:hypothetical protein
MQKGTNVLNCDLGLCKDYFPDNEDGLTTLLWHKIIKHQTHEINGRANGRLDC